MVGEMGVLCEGSVVLGLPLMRTSFSELQLLPVPCVLSTERALDRERDVVVLGDVCKCRITRPHVPSRHSNTTTQQEGLLYLELVLMTNEAMRKKTASMS